MTVLPAPSRARRARTALKQHADVVVCVVTLRRPDRLAELLAALRCLRSDGTFEVRLVVIDNDPSGSARRVVDDAANTPPWPRAYVVEPRRGLASARNAALSVAGDADAVVFIDDDEIPEPGWLCELVEVQRASGADVVGGPVIPVFDEDPPLWVVGSGAFSPRRFPSGSYLEWANTGNVLITAGVFRSLDGIRFDRRFDLSGGEDTHFFLRASRAGRTIVWADSAVIHERVPRDRLRLRWILRRSYRRGNTLSLCLLDLDPRPVRLFRRAVHAMLRISFGVVLVLSAPCRTRADAVRGAREACFGAGMIAGLLGVRCLEYGGGDTDPFPTPGIPG